MKKLLLLFSLPFTLVSFSQNDLYNIRFRHLTTNDGLPSNDIKCIIQDKNGFMWFGTSSGLVRYDGYSFKTYIDTSVSSDHSIFCMAQDDEELIWTGSRRRGISVFNPKTEKFKHYTHNKDDSTSLNFHDITSLCKDKDGEMWVGTRAGLNKYDREKDCFIRFEKLPGSPGTLFGLFVDKNNLLWCCSHYNGLNSFDKKNQVFKHYSFPPEFNCSYSAISVDEDSTGNFFIGTRGGLVIFNPKEEKFTNCFQNNPKDISSLSGNDMFLSQTIVDSRNIVWVGTWNYGVNIFHREKNNFIRYQHNVNFPASISDNHIRCIYEDNAGFIWIGTENGINIYNPRSSSFTVYQSITNDEQTLSSNAVSALYEDSHNRIWVGTSNAGLNLLDKENNKFIRYKNNPSDKSSLQSNIVSSICGDEQEMLWIMNTWGLPKSIFNLQTNKFRNLNELFAKSNCPLGECDNVVYKDSKGLMWIGGHGAHAYNPASKKFICYDSGIADTLKQNLRYIGVIYEDIHGNIWLGSFVNGINIFYQKDGRFVNFKNNPEDKNSISHNAITSIFQDSKGVMWIGTVYGLNQYNPNGKKFRHYFQKDGLPDNSISAILEDKESNLWVSTGKGLCRFNPGENTFFTYDETDGLPGNEFTDAACKGKEGKFYFGTSNGLVSFFPERIKNNSDKPLVFLTKFTVLNKPWSIPQEIGYTKAVTLSYREYFFSLEFAALDYSAPKKNQYAYKLEGFNREWVNLGNKREVTFTNLDAGDYVLKVKASNNHGLWSDEKEVLKITITPPWWKTTWFRICVLIFIICSVIFYIKWRERKLRVEKAILEEKVKVRTKVIEEQKDEIEVKSGQLEIALKDVTDSIHYAQNIQKAILTPIENLRKLFSESFILFKPKDIVSGDFYFFTKVNQYTIIAACDCTGHGVPGAFMSMIGSQLLNEIVNDKSVTDAALVLNQLRDGIIHAFGEAGAAGKQKDGMDMALCCLTPNPSPNGEGNKSFPLEGEVRWGLQYAGAYNSLYIIKKGSKELIEVKPDKQPVGYTADKKPFTNHNIQLQKGDTIYIFSDGYQDQFGGPKGKKFMSKQLRQLFSDIVEMSIEEQEKYMNKIIADWKGNLEQTDDICVIGIRV